MKVEHKTVEVMKNLEVTVKLSQCEIGELLRMGRLDAPRYGFDNQVSVTLIIEEPKDDERKADK